MSVLWFEMAGFASLGGLAPELLSMPLVSTSHQPDRAERPAESVDFKAILLVDDDKQLAITLQWILADENFLVDVAYDGEEALLKVRANVYDAVICDVMMPNLRGTEFYLHARELRPTLSDRFIFITGFAADPQVNLFLTRNDVKYLVKPFPVQQLISCVRELLS
jgi:DNA-binding response OmpR family regulator